MDRVILAWLMKLPVGLHRDQRGSMSILAVFAVVMLTTLLGMVVNVGLQVDGKVTMQNAADAAAYSGGVVLARGMNGLVFTNHLIAEVFALHAFLTEGQERNAEQFTSQILDAWREVARELALSSFYKFINLGSGPEGIPTKADAEQLAVDDFGQWAYAAAGDILPVLEEILGPPGQDGLIPEFQRALVLALPGLAQQAAGQVAQRYGNTRNGRRIQAVFWRNRPGIEAVGGPSEADWQYRTLPVVDPVLEGSAAELEDARTIRHRFAHSRLGRWNWTRLNGLNYYAKMSQFYWLWNGLTHGHLEELLSEHPTSNLPFLIRVERPAQMAPQPWWWSDRYPPRRGFGFPCATMQDREQEVWETKPTSNVLVQDYTFTAVCYWPHLSLAPSNAFANPFRGSDDGGSRAFAQALLFIPKRRLVWDKDRGVSFPMGWCGMDPDRVPTGGIVRQGTVFQSGLDEFDAYAYKKIDHCWKRRDDWEDWDLTNQRWTVKLVPATAITLAEVLGADPAMYVPEVLSAGTMGLGDLESVDIWRISNH